MTWDAIVIGSGFGGVMAAHALVNGGQRVLMLERGGWVGRGPENWGARGAGLVTPHYSKDAPYHVTAGGKRYRAGAWNCVGGQSIFYGGASYRFRERDFEHHEEIVGDSNAEWPFRYDDIEPYYSEAEQLLGVAGDPSGEPGAPRRSVPYAQGPTSLTRSARTVAEAAARLGMTPSRIPLAIAYGASGTRRGCIKCGSCDGYACPAEAKNDLASTVIPELIRLGMTLRTNTIAVRLIRSGTRITEVECVNRVTGERERLSARRVVLGAGTLATPHLLLASHLELVNTARHAVGRYLTRHRNAVVLGVFARRPNPTHDFDKQIAILDFYHEAGSIQQMTPPVGLVRAYMPPIVRGPAGMVMSHASGLLVIAEDQPVRGNGVTADWSNVDRYGMPKLHVHQKYSRRDEASAAVLIANAKRVLREAGALFTIVHPIETFSHALGTVRMGCNDRTSPLDENGRYRGLDNLYVTDGSALPRSAGLNPSLTIAANALRIGAHLTRTSRSTRGRSIRALPVWPQPLSPIVK